ncbi:MAG: hypothetical protein LBU70_05430 [Chitinispirillales bacterium]|jgi:hypothetical protein|nr:hypothetical protein [Chitinispirillales bacterium]
MYADSEASTADHVDYNVGSTVLAAFAEPRGRRSDSLGALVAAGTGFANQNVELVPRNSVTAIQIAESGAVRKGILMLPDGGLYDIYGLNHKKGDGNMNHTVDTGVANKKTAAPAGIGNGVVDSNRFYSMLLDARSPSASVTENMHDVAERLLKGEKDNAKLALDQLWALKKALSDDNNTGEAVESLISYYQDKIDVLRQKEEVIKKVSRDTRELVEEKRRKDEELAIIKSQISGHEREVTSLSSKLDALKKREGELIVAEKRLREELSCKENLIVGGLYDIILHDASAHDGSGAAKTVKQAIRKSASRNVEVHSLDEKEEGRVEDLNGDDGDAFAMLTEVAKVEEPVYRPIIYPKSLVRMGGKVIGEYYHDGRVAEKNKRHYIYNGKFMADSIAACIRVLKDRFCRDLYAELVRTVEDATSRVQDNGRFHFEISTNEIVNFKNLRQLTADLRGRDWEEAERFAVRLSAKIDALGANYGAMLKEQMERYSAIG